MSDYFPNIAEDDEEEKENSRTETRRKKRSQVAEHHNDRINIQDFIALQKGQHIQTSSQQQHLQHPQQQHLQQPQRRQLQQLQQFLQQPQQEEAIDDYIDNMILEDYNNNNNINTIINISRTQCVIQRKCIKTIKTR